MDARLVFLVGLGGFFGTVCRFFVGQWANAAFSMPGLGTVIVNVVGSFLIGLFYGFGKDVWQEQTLLILTTGVLGGFTTFSAFSGETVALLRAERWSSAAAFVVVMVILGLGATWLGLAAARWWR